MVALLLLFVLQTQRDLADVRQSVKLLEEKCLNLERHHLHCLATLQDSLATVVDKETAGKEASRTIASLHSAIEVKDSVISEKVIFASVGWLGPVGYLRV